MATVSENEFCVLRSMQNGGWLRPMDFGGHDGSHHSATAAKLVRKGLAERRARGVIFASNSRGSYEYRITRMLSLPL